MKKPEKYVTYTTLQGAVILAAILMLINHYHTLDIYHYELAKDENSERNERSTPRSFILPATPGVAFQQEKERDTASGPDQIAKCVSILRNLGYRIDGNVSLFNAKLSEAIYTFQVDHNLTATGTIDPATLRAIKCK